ncbi:hypothetical protein ACTFIW_011856 [Dictyostelium discoideum]
MKYSITLIIVLLSLISLCNLSNSRMFGQKCNLPPIPQTLDNGSQVVILLAELLQNDKVISSYNNTFSKGTGSTFFSDTNNVCVFNSGENLHIEYKVVSGSSGIFYSEDCKSNDSIPTSSSTVKLYNGGFVFMGSKFTYQYKLTLKTN